MRARLPRAPQSLPRAHPGCHPALYFVKLSRNLHGRAQHSSAPLTAALIRTRHWGTPCQPIASGLVSWEAGATRRGGHGAGPRAQGALEVRQLSQRTSESRGRKGLRLTSGSGVGSDLWMLLSHPDGTPSNQTRLTIYCRAGGSQFRAGCSRSGAGTIGMAGSPCSTACRWFSLLLGLLLQIMKFKTIWTPGHGTEGRRRVAAPLSTATRGARSACLQGSAKRRACPNSAAMQQCHHPAPPVSASQAVAAAVQFTRSANTSA